MANFWDKLRAGWQVVWAVEIEGVPVLWTERTLDGLTPPSGYSISPDLIIDRSAEVGSLADRSTGLGAGLPLTFRLRDSATARAWAMSPSATTALAGAIAATDTTLTVEDTTGFDAAGTVWAGTEAITYTGKTGTQFTGCTRGAHRSRAVPHGEGAISSLVCNLPRHYRGRLVTLSALLVTPSGNLDVSVTYEDLAKIVWRGTVETGARRSGGAFEFEALALDRLLSRPLAPLGAGTITGLESRFPVQPSFSFRVWWQGFDNTGTVVNHYDINVFPFAALTAGDLLTTAEAHAMIQDAWASAIAVTTCQVTAVFATAHFQDDLGIYKTSSDFYPNAYQDDYQNKVKSGSWGIYATHKADASIVKVVWQVSVGNKTTIPWGLPSKGQILYPSPSLKNGDMVGFGWYHGGNPCMPSASASPLPASGVTITLDDPTALIPQPGWVKTDKGIYTYKTATYVADGLYLTGCAIPAKVGDKVEFGSQLHDSYANLMRALITSGDSSGWSTFDLLGAGQGYALPAIGDRWASFVDEDSFDIQAVGALVALGDSGLAGHGGESLEAHFGGALALAQRCIVLREEGSNVNDPCRLGLISTEPGGSGYAETLTDSDLISSSESPITILETREVLTAVKAEFLPGVGQDAGLKVNVFDGVELAAIGGETLAVTLPSVGNFKDAADAIAGWATSLLAAARTLQAAELHCPPWKSLTLGGLVQLDLTHPDLWNSATGETRYLGVARIIGLRRSLQDCSVIATVLLGSGQTAELCPSIPILSYTGAAGNPTSLTVDPVAAALLLEAQGAASPVAVQHTRPGCGSEASGGGLLITVQVDGDGYATGVLTVVWQTLGQNLDTTSEITFPNLTNGSDWQDGFAHVDDPSKWS